MKGFVYGNYLKRNLVLNAVADVIEMSFKYAISVVFDDILYDINHIIEQLHNKPDGLLFEDAEPTEVCEGYVFTPVCQSFCSGGGGG